MSSLFGPLVQQGYVVPDVDAAVAHWLARGVGPFFIADIKDMSGVYDGEHIYADMRAGFAYSGDQQIEVITPVGTDPSIYKDYLQSNPAGGLQHLAYWVDDIDDKLSEISG
ncbi:MAG: VOC family protein, partial [Pseudomonadales bacterium]|nr:VOC family protein [Pseudomonadales bacterium]